jgi:hypothetical protein
VTATTAVVDLERADLVRALRRVPIPFTHHLADHPAFDLDQLADTAAVLPDCWSLSMEAVDEILEPEDFECVVPEFTIDQVVRGLGENDCMGRLYHLDLVGEYREAAGSVFAWIDEAVGHLEGGIVAREGSAFLASPGAVTACHPDRHHNLLLQLRGTKDLWVGRFPDPARSQAEIERTFVSLGKGPTELPSDATLFRLGPGDGVYIPPYGFHWATVTGDSASVALSCGWSTADSERDALVHAFNLRMRQRTSLRPRPPGSSRSRDRVKAALMRRRLDRLGIEQ